MKLSLITAGIAGALALFACATTQDAPPAVTPPDEAGLPAQDAAITDAGPDAARDGEAGLPACSPDGFCPTEVAADQSLQAVWGDDAGTLWAVSAGGSILRYDASDASQAWKVHASSLGALNAVWGSGPTDVWVGGKQGLFHGTGARPTALVFTAVAAPGAADLAITSIWGTGPSDVWAVGGVAANRDVFPSLPPRSRVLHHGGTTDAGAAWTLDTTLSSKAAGLTEIWGSAKSGVWIAGQRPMATDEFSDEAVVYRKAASAGSFTEVVLPHDPASEMNAPYDVLAKLVHGSMSDDSTLWITGHTWFEQPGYIRGTSADNGVTFTYAYTDATVGDPTLNAIVAVSVGEAWAVGDYGRVRHWTTADPSWSQAAVTRSAFPIVTPFHAAWASKTNDLWIVGDGIALHKDPNAKKAGDP